MVDSKKCYEDGFLDVTGADGVEIMISDPIGGVGVGNLPVIHLTVMANKTMVANVRICRIAGPIQVLDNRRPQRENIRRKSKG